jgi:predicted nucleic acid-binding protein
MILTDSSMVIDYLRTGDPKNPAVSQAHGAAVGGVTRAEILHGTRNRKDRQRLLTVLNAFGQVPIPDSLWDDVGDNLAALRAAGVTVPFPDVVIATVAIANGIELWTRDNQFTMMQQVLPRLRLFQEPPPRRSQYSR